MFKLVLCGLCLLVFLIWGGARIINNIQFDRNCGDYLKRAGDANTIDLAKDNLKIAVDYARNNGLTSGYTSIVYRSPDEDVGFWYNNLVASLEELQSIKPDATQLEKTNVLMKLRETLLDHGSDGVEVTAPSGISIHPRNGFYCMWAWLSLAFAVAFGIWGAVEINSY